MRVSPALAHSSPRLWENSIKIKLAAAIHAVDVAASINAFLGEIRPK